MGGCDGSFLRCVEFGFRCRLDDGKGEGPVKKDEIEQEREGKVEDGRSRNSTNEY